VGNMAAAMVAATGACVGLLGVSEMSVSSSSRAAAPSSLLAQAALGNRRPSLRKSPTLRSSLARTCAKSQVSITCAHDTSSIQTTTSTNLESEIELKSAADKANFFLQRALLAATASFTPFLLTAQDAYAAGGEFGILEGRIFSLIHPIVMISLFVATGYAGYLGWQWRRVRTIQDDINALKKQVPVAAEGQTAPSPIEAQIKELSEERKVLVKGGFRDRHFNWGSILLGTGVLFSVSGAVNTYLRTGKLFPGPHLYAGVGITVLWALAAALVPPMQKGNETARSLHIAFNTVNLLLFAWQIPTGWEIVLKVFEFTKFP